MLITILFLSISTTCAIRAYDVEKADLNSYGIDGEKLFPYLAAFFTFFVWPWFLAKKVADYLIKEVK